MLPTIVQHHVLPPGRALQAGGSVVQKEWLAAMASAQDILDAAQDERRKVLEEASAQAERVAFDAAIEAQRSVWLSVQAALQSVAQLRVLMLEQAEDLLVELARSALGLLLLDVPSDWPARSSVRLVLKQWGGAGEAKLLVHPDEVEAVIQAVDGQWRSFVQADPAVPAGDCLLSAGQMQLRASYVGSVDSLLAAQSEERQPPSAQHSQIPVSDDDGDSAE